ncbi:hypothetical protein ACFL0W_00420 [Nanoarchaeota archaeon]
MRDITDVEKDILYHWKRLIRVLHDNAKIDLGKIWLNESLDEIKKVEHDVIELIPWLKERLGQVKGEKEAERLIELLDELIKHKDIDNVEIWFKEVSDDLKKLIAEIDKRLITPSELRMIGDKMVPPVLHNNYTLKAFPNFFNYLKQFGGEWKIKHESGIRSSGTFTERSWLFWDNKQIGRFTYRYWKEADFIEYSGHVPVDKFHTVVMEFNYKTKKRSSRKGLSEEIPFP